MAGPKEDDPQEAHFYSITTHFSFFILFRRNLMEQGVDFTIEAFKPRKHGPRSDKGKNHKYPKSRRKWE